MRDVRASGVDIMTFGQYLRPTKNHLPVKRFVEPKEFEEWKKVGEEMEHWLGILDWLFVFSDNRKLLFCTCQKGKI